MKAASSRKNKNNATRRRNNNKNAKVAHAKTFLTRKVRKVIEEIHEDLKAGHVLPPKLRAYLERLIVEDLKRLVATLLSRALDGGNEVSQGLIVSLLQHANVVAGRERRC